MPWKPHEPGEVPTLGYDVLDWMAEHLATPDRQDFEPFQPTMEQAQFIINFYAIDPRTGRRRYRRGVISRPKGWGKSPLLSAIACAEALAPVVPDGWDANGRPVGKPWIEVRTPLIQLCAVSEDQTQNSWDPLLEMLREGPACDAYPGLEPMNSFVNLPYKGKIMFVTANATSREGNKPCFVVLDQTETWLTNNGGVKLAATLRRNLGKTGGSSIESPNAFVPGEQSVAEVSANYYLNILEGKARDEGLLYDHREAPPETDLYDRESLMRGLEIAYGEAAESAGGWVDLDRIIAEIWDPATDPQAARRYYLNAITHATDSWLSQPEWAACADPLKVVADGDMITLGFDGSRHRSDTITDATALVGCRLEDGHIFPIGIWEQPDNQRDWWAPTAEIDATVRDAFRRWNVVAMYADPAADWRSFVAGWEADFNDKLKVKVTSQHPCEWWLGGQNLTKTVRATAQFHSAVVHKELTHDGSSAMTRHVLNARRRDSRVGLVISKDFPESPRKIDAAVAGILAWQARLDAVGQGVLAQQTKRRSRAIKRF
jgi:phage terminase large subunit-like protein